MFPWEQTSPLQKKKATTGAGIRGKNSFLQRQSALPPPHPGPPSKLYFNSRSSPGKNAERVKKVSRGPFSVPPPFFASRASQKVYYSSAEE